MVDRPAAEKEVSTAPSGEALPPGTLLDHYVIQSVLGRGAFGITYLATERRLERYVAIKEYLPRGFATRRSDSSVAPSQGEDEELFRYGLDRMLSEAKTIIQFNHANIVKVLTYFEVNGTAYIVMQYEEGQNLGDHLRRNYPLTERQLLNIVCPINEGLGLVHRTGFIHRDIKPDNIYLRSDNSPVLIDFGAARNVFTTKADQLTRILTHGFAPYEQEAPTWADQGPWTDIYALGATLYFAIMLRSAPPANARVNVLENPAGDIYTPLQAAPDGTYSQSFLKAIDWALEFRPTDRPQTIEDWSKALNGGTVPDTSARRTSVVVRSSAGYASTRIGTDQPVVEPVQHLAAPVGQVGAAYAETRFGTAQEREESGQQRATLTVAGENSAAYASTRVTTARETAAASKRKTSGTWIKGAVATGLAAVVASLSFYMYTDDAVEASPPVTPPVEAIATVAIDNLVKPALIVARTSGEKYIVVRKSRKLIEEMKGLDETPERKKFISDLRLKQAEAGDAFEAGMREYGAMIKQLRAFPADDVESAVRRVLAEPVFSSDRAHAAIGGLLAVHVTDANSQSSAWKQDIQTLSKSPGVFSR